MNMNREQFCSECRDPTGRAGNFHESLFVQIPGEDEPKGPLCDTCADALSNEYSVEIQRI